MKKINVLLGVLLLATSSLFAQSNNEEVEFIQSILGMEKKEIVAEFITLEDENATNFWAEYDQYEVERKAQGKKRIDLLNKYADNYLKLDDTKTEEIMKEMIALGSGYNKLINKYYKRIKKASGIKAAGQFYQLEIYIQSAIRISIMEQIPFLGELDVK